MAMKNILDYSEGLTQEVVSILLSYYLSSIKVDTTHLRSVILTAAAVLLKLYIILTTRL